MTNSEIVKSHILPLFTERLEIMNTFNIVVKNDANSKVYNWFGCSLSEMITLFSTLYTVIIR